MTVDVMTSRPPSPGAATFLTTLTGGGPVPGPPGPPPRQRGGPGRPAGLPALLDAEVDPDTVDREGEIPLSLIARLKDLGAFRLSAPEDLGGLGLSPQEVFDVVEAAASRSAAIGVMLGVHNGIGVGTSLLPALPYGSLRDLIRRRVTEGVISGFADTEPTGGGNRWPRTTATPTADGSAYTLKGDKLFVSNGPVAGLLGVTATVREPDGKRVGLAVVDTRSPGFEVRAGLEYLGVRGLPNGWLRFDEVVVPRDHLVTVPDGDPRHTPRLMSAVLSARLLIQAAPALAIARNCLRWSREFVARRRIEGIGLGEYDLVQRTLAAGAADVRAMDTVVRWSLGAPAPHDRWFERMAARNFCTDACARIVDRTVSLLGGEGLETARSKRRRGALPVPLERAYRDARMLRTIGGVDDMLDVRMAQALLAHVADGPGHDPEPVALADTGKFFPRTEGHARALDGELARFSAVCRAAGPQVTGAEGQYRLLLLGRISRELFGMAAVLAAAGNDGQHRLTDIHCTAARLRLRDAWARFDTPDEADHASVARALVFRDRHMDELLGL
ncbi:acyl-CoA/acyl-ACP dehydrogenase [Streptomyces pseudovenezuelae]|uniref:Acyl-CoA/acyl-ACP dehydrogenase n=1 Tax=Streptomyces pseudovenezuelae TaxID=67350 RepID=A0ABZ1X4J8_9ACTN|nr:acyl-CoA dehydrogenase family protein [Streptomyces pseudovenezuelae]